MALELPLAQPAVPRERADARRNRQRILCAAARLIEREGLGAVSMDDVAAEAGVGKGTLYRRFGDRATLVRALVDEQERDFQDEVIRGAAPLGPGAPPLERLHAFGDAHLRFLDRHADFVAASEASVGSRFRTDVYAFHRTHIGVLLRQHLGEEHPRLGYFADILLAALSGDLFLWQRYGEGLALDELRAGWHALADALLA
jgi:AcrR family transcriptional regulator